MSLPLPTDQLTQLFTETTTIAVVGASNNDRKPAHTIPRYLQRAGYRVIPVNPRGGEILGVEAAASLADVEDDIDIVNVFRPAAETPAIAAAAAAAGAKVLWLQLGIESDEARRIAEDAGLTVVMDACLGATHKAWAGSANAS